MKYIVLFVSLVSISFQSKAMYFSSYIYEMGSKEEFISKHITNDSETRNLYSVDVYPIEKPSNINEIELNTVSKDILYAPLRHTIDKKTSDIFKFYYRGPKDDKERYYRVVFTETPLTLYKNDKNDRASTYIPSISLSTFLIVRPRKEHFKYILDDQKGMIKNIGNTFFRAIVHDGCDSTDEDADHVYILPGEEYQNDLIKNNRVFLVINKQYISLNTNKCSEQSAIEGSAQ